MASPILKINAGGKIFEVRRSTLIKNTFFKTLIEHDEKNGLLNIDIGGTNNGTIFIEEQRHIFKHVLALIQNPKYYYPEKYLSYLEFYQISTPVNIVPIIDTQIERCNKRIDIVESTLNLTIDQVNIMIERKDAKRMACWGLDTYIEVKSIKHDSNASEDEIKWIRSYDLLSDYIESDDRSSVSSYQVRTSDGNFTNIISVESSMVKQELVNVDGIILTHGHPIYYKDTWCKPRNCGYSVYTQICTVMNLVLESCHEIYVKSNPDSDNKLLIATLGRFDRTTFK